MDSASSYVCGAATHLLVAGSLLAGAYRLFGGPGAACAIVAVLLSVIIVPVVVGKRRRPAGIPSAGNNGRMEIPAPAAGTAPAGNGQIELPAVFKYKRDAGAAPLPDCSICLGQIGVGEKVRRLPECGHVFHVRCIDEWLRENPSCPVCRAAAWQV